MRPVIKATQTSERQDSFKMPTVQRRQNTVTTTEPDPEDPHFVHEEVRQLASQVGGVIRQHFQRHGTNENEVINGVKQYGVSAQSRLMMEKEKAAAEMAHLDGVYGVWRNENARHEINRDFCSRIGPLHKCFCGHSLRDHAKIVAGRKGPVSPPCQQCQCDEYRYIPNEPEEVGEHWLARRKGFVPGTWSAKCRCGHSCEDHDPKRRGGSCNACQRCFKFDGHFLCGVCDGKYTDHYTIFETENERKAAGRSVRQEFMPLHNLDSEVQDIVFGNGVGAQQINGKGHPLPQTNFLRPTSESKNKEQTISKLPILPKTLSEPSSICLSCGSAFRSLSSKFCSNCGAKR